MKATWILPIILVLYFLICGDFILKFTNKKTKIVTTIEYSGLLWVFLDWNLRKRIPLPEELDTPRIKFFSITKTKQHEDSKSHTTDPAAGRL